MGGIGMRSYDLMIGDWVFSPREDKPVRVVRISELDGSIGVFDNDKLFDITAYEPIPLTKEILEQNGFVITNEDCPFVWEIICVYRTVTVFYKEKKCTVFVDIDTSHPITFADINYVHELQHVLKIGGVDKQIRL